MFTRSKKQRGYTLGELLTAMSVMGILTAVAVPGMQSMMANNRRVAMTNDLSYTMQLARSEAISRNQQITVCPSTNGLGCNGDDWTDGWIVFNDLDRNRAFGVDERILLTVEGQDGIDIYTAEFSDFFTYRPNGRIIVDSFAENSGQFTICDARGNAPARVLFVTTAGRPRVSEYQPNGSAPNCS